MVEDFDVLKYEPKAIEVLANYLNRGELSLFIGAGMSKGFSLPGWLGLVNDLRAELNLDPLDEKSNSEQIQLGADEVLAACKDGENELIQLIEKHLYSTLKDVDTIDIFNNRALLALSALMIGSKRGRVRQVITLNYDNMLEWFLRSFGFVVKSIYELPSLEGSEDVVIYHPHGFIPHPSSGGKSSDFVILGLQSAHARIGQPGDPWVGKIQSIIESSVCLFIGMSPNTLSDAALSPIWINSFNKMTGRPLGVWLVLEDLLPAKVVEFKGKGIVPLRMATKEDIPPFLLKICQESMNNNA